MSLLGFFQQTAFLGTGLFLSLMAFSCLMLPVVTAVRAPETFKDDLVLGLGLLPFWGTFFVLLAALLPSFLEVTGLSRDHCLGHDSGHLHYCLVHLPEIINRPSVWFVAALFPVILSVSAIRLVLDVTRLHVFRRSLDALATDGLSSGICLVETELPLAVSCGLKNARIWLSRGLADSLGSDELDLVIAHEKAHIRRSDALRKLLLCASVVLFPRYFRNRFVYLHELYSEIACDSEAAGHGRQNTVLAELLLKMESLYQEYHPAKLAVAPSFTGHSGSTIPERVKALLQDPKTKENKTRRKLVVTVCALFLIAVVLNSHDFLEHTVSHFVST